MPYRISKFNDCFRVINTHTGQIIAKFSSSEKALAKVRLLEMIDKYKVKIII
jgi:hypothetical protein